MKRKDVRFDGTIYLIKLAQSPHMEPFTPIQFVQEDAGWGKPLGGLVVGRISDGREISVSCKRLKKEEMK